MSVSLYNSALPRAFVPDQDIPGSAEFKRRGGVGHARPRRVLLCQHLLIALETLLLRAQLCAELGDERSKLADVIKALELAGPEGSVSIFIEEGPPVFDVLAGLLKSGLPTTIPASYVQELLSAFPAREPSHERLIPQSDLREPVYESISARSSFHSKRHNFGTVTFRARKYIV